MTDAMTQEQKEFCVKVAQWMGRVKTFPGGNAFIVDLFTAAISAEGLEVIDKLDPKITLRRQTTQELYDALWTCRELRKSGYTMQTAAKLGLAEHYQTYGSQGLVRYLEVATNAALHNAGLEGFHRSEPSKNRMN